MFLCAYVVKKIPENQKSQKMEKRFTNSPKQTSQMNAQEGAGAVFCFGEMMFRISPSLNRQWIKQASVPLYLAGAELNVASALAKWNLPVKYCTALPENYLSHEIIDELKEKNIDTSAIQFSGNRIGVYYLPEGADLKNAGVIYDRSHSSFSELKTGMIDWENVLKDCSWFHFSAITPALNENIAALCKEGLEAARKKGLTISVDLNYRAKLWKYGKQPVDVMPELVKYCSVVMGNIWSAENLLGITSSLKESKGKMKKELLEAAGKSMKQVHITYPSVASIAYTFRLEELYYGVLQHGPKLVVSNEFLLQKTIDNVGSGDCFMGGLIYGLYHQHPPQQVVNFAAAAAFGKLNEKGDATNQTIEDIDKLIKQSNAIKNEI